MTKAKRQGGCKRCNKPKLYVLISSILSGGILYTTASAANTVTTQIHPRTEETLALSGLDSKPTPSYPEQMATSPKPEMAATSPENLTTEAFINKAQKLRQAIPVPEASPLVKPEIIASITDVNQMPANIPNLARVVTTATALKQSGESGPTIEQTTPQLPQTTPQLPQTTPQPQQMMLSDVQGNWAQSLIVALADQGIIRGYPDGTFQPNAPMTRAEFAAIITKAFPKAPVRGTANFVDVPTNYWDYNTIQTAYSIGFMSGTRDGRFNPEDNITRVDVLVALANGLNLPPSNQPITFQDATQIPDYARSSIATAVANHLIVNYPDINFLNPNKIATRADVAAFIYQALVNSGAVKPLAASDTTNQYIVGYQPPSVTPSPAPTTPTTPPDETAQPPSPEEIRKLQSQIQRLEGISFRQIYLITPSLAGGSPSGFGLNWGQAFLGVGGVFRTRYTQKLDGAITIGFGLGNARTALGLEIVPVITSLAGGSGNGLFGSGGASFKLHRLLGPDVSVAVGIEDLIQYGPRDTQTSGYGVISKVFRLQPNTGSLFSRLYTSVGVGGGRFRSEHDIFTGKGSVNVFGGVGLLVTQPLSVYADWTGQDLNLGASVVPLRNLPLVITGFMQDVTGNAGDGVRLGGSVGYSISF